MADKNYQLAFKMSDGSTKTVNFTAPQGPTGPRGTGILKVTTAPSSYTTATGGFTPTYRISLSTVKTQSNVSSVLVGDVIQYNYYQYPVGYVDSSYVYLGARTSIRGSTGAAGTNGTDGADGYTPVKGVDYFTPADQEAIVQQVIAALGTPVFGRVDENNNIILSGELADETYTVKYEDADGNLLEVGTIMREPPVTLDVVYGLPGRDSSTSIVYYSDNEGQTNQKMVYQTTGDVPFYTSAALSTATTYYPLVVPDGKTKIVLTFPNLTSSQKLVMAVRSLTLDGNAYKQATSSGWLAEGTYEWSFAAGTKYVAPYFRNNSYGGLDLYDFSGFTVSWE